MAEEDSIETKAQFITLHSELRRVKKEMLVLNNDRYLEHERLKKNVADLLDIVKRQSKLLEKQAAVHLDSLK